MKSLLSIDFGDKRTGFAKSDELGLLAHPHSVFKTHPYGKLLVHMKSIVEEFNMGGIVLGVPYGESERITKQTEKVLRFKAKLENDFDIPVYEIDESYSSKMALDMAHQRGQNFKQIKKDIDAQAAAIFLQDFLDRVTPQQKEEIGEC